MHGYYKQSWKIHLFLRQCLTLFSWCSQCLGLSCVLRSKALVSCLLPCHNFLGDEGAVFTLTSTALTTGHWPLTSDQTGKSPLVLFCLCVMDAELSFLCHVAIVTRCCLHFLTFKLLMMRCDARLPAVAVSLQTNKVEGTEPVSCPWVSGCPKLSGLNCACSEENVCKQRLIDETKLSVDVRVSMLIMFQENILQQ